MLVFVGQFRVPNDAATPSFSRLAGCLSVLLCLASPPRSAKADSTGTQPASVSTAPASTGLQLTLTPPYDSGQLTGIRQLLTAGIGYQGSLLSKQDVCGLAFAWGEPADPTLRHQSVAEAFYRVQLSPANQLSIGYEMVIHPVFAPQDEVEGVFWTRLRILF